MKYELFIAKRYLTARRKQAFISVITFISVLGIAIGVMALVIALSLITGFQSDVQHKILDSTSHIMVSDLTGQGLKDYKEIQERIRALDGVITASPVAYDIGLVSGPYKSFGAMIKGIDFEVEKESSYWLQNLDQGEVPSKDAPREEIMLGRRLALEIGAGLGDVIRVLTSSSRLSPMGLVPKSRMFRVSGIFHTGLYEFDSSTALVHLETAQQFLGMEDRITYIQVKIKDIFKAPDIGRRIEEMLPNAAFVTTWMELNASLFSALKLEKTIIFLTITLIVIVAALNIIASLILMVMEKTRDIGILIAMGATARSIRRIFFLQGAMIGLIGTFAGVALGLFVGWLANTFQLIKVPVDIYQIAYVPFYIQLPDLLMIIVVTLAISFLSTLFPSHRAAKVDPVVALKYE
jgi:lipoprotein-releasing system permease protein